LASFSGLLVLLYEALIYPPRVAVAQGTRFSKKERIARRTRFSLRLYYIVPRDAVGQKAFAVIRGLWRPRAWSGWTAWCWPTVALTGLDAVVQFVCSRFNENRSSVRMTNPLTVMPAATASSRANRTLRHRLRTPRSYAVGPQKARVRTGPRQSRSRRFSRLI
jgi:hypothetical protein